jgi:hypothetical protein
MTTIFVVTIQDRGSIDECGCGSTILNDVHVFATKERAIQFCEWYVIEKGVKRDDEIDLIDCGNGETEYIRHGDIYSNNPFLRLTIYERAIPCAAE